MPRITRDTFISADIVDVALSKATMCAIGEDGQSIVEVPIPKSMKETKTIPEEYAIGD